VFATSAYGGYSACRQYQEDIERARKAVREGAP
jgi:ferrochelatase